MGSIYKRGDSPYWWMKWKGADGKRHAAATRFRTGDPAHRAEALRTLELLERRVEAERGAGGGVLTVRGFADTWLESLRRRKVATADQTAQRLRDFVHPLLGALPLREVRPHHLVELLEVLEAEHQLAPRTRRGVYGILHAMFHRAVRKELVPGNPCALEKHELPPNVDADPAWRATAVYTRGEVEQLLSDERVRADRRVLNALLFLAGLRIGEALARTWADYDAAAEPLGKLEVPTSWSTVREEVSPTKTKVARAVPVHPLLAQVLAEWRLSGWAAFVGRPPRADDLLIPSRAGEHRNAQVCLERHHADLERLGLRRRRLHDARVTFISLAQADGAPPHLLKWVTHGQRTGIMDVYTRPQWEALSGAVSKLRIRRLGAREVAALPRAANSGGSAHEDDRRGVHPVGAERGRSDAGAARREGPGPIAVRHAPERGGRGCEDHRGGAGGGAAPRTGGAGVGASELRGSPATLHTEGPDEGLSRRRTARRGTRGPNAEVPSEPFRPADDSAAGGTPAGADGEDARRRGPLPRAEHLGSRSGELRSATLAGTPNEVATLEAIRSTTSVDPTASAGPGSAHHPGETRPDGLQQRPEQPAERSQRATLTLLPPAGLTLDDPYGFLWLIQREGGR